MSYEENMKEIEKIKDRIKSEYPSAQFRGWSGYTWGIRKDQWYGVIPKNAGPYTGTLISVLNGEEFVIRDYPEVVKGTKDDAKPGLRIHPKINGVEISNFIDGSGEFWGRTRFVEYLERNSRFNRNLQLLLDMTGYSKAIERVCRDHNVAVFGVLFGKHLPGGYAKYPQESKYLVYDVLDLKTNKFLKPKEMKSLMSQYSLPVVKTIKKEDIDYYQEKHGGVYVKDYSGDDLSITLIQDLKPKDAVQEAAIRLWAEYCDFRARSTLQFSNPRLLQELLGKSDCTEETKRLIEVLGDMSIDPPEREDRFRDAIRAFFGDSIFDKSKEELSKVYEDNLPRFTANGMSLEMFVSLVEGGRK